VLRETYAAAEGLDDAQERVSNAASSLMIELGVGNEGAGETGASTAPTAMSAE
jgi:hypothetical protein